MNTPMRIILQNFPHNSEYTDDSFLGTLHKKDVWDKGKYMELKRAIERLTIEVEGDSIPRNIAWPITRIFSHTMLLIQTHYDKNDGCDFANISNDELFDLRDDFQLTVEKFFSHNKPTEYID